MSLPVKMESLSSLETPFNYWNMVIRSLLSLLFSRRKNPYSLSLSSYGSTLFTHTELDVYWTPRSLSTKLPPRHVDPSVCCTLGLCFPKWKISHLFLLNFIMLSHSSSPPSTSCRVAFPSKVSTSSVWYHEQNSSGCT